MKMLSKHSDKIYALTRMVVGFLFACHGAQKLLGMFGGTSGGMSGLMLYTAGGIELIGGLFIAIGFQTSLSAFLSSGLMAVAYFMVHQPKGALPIQNHGELAVVYCWLFLYISAIGNGIWSVGGASSRGESS